MISHAETCRARAPHRLVAIALVAVATVLASLPHAAQAVSGAAGRHGGPAENVIVLGPSSEAAAAAVGAVDGEVELELAVVGGVAADLTGAQIADLEAAGLHVAVDEAMHVAGASFAATTATAAVEAMEPIADAGIDAGAGVAVALVDTGVTEVPELAGRVVYGPDLSGEGTMLDSFGHGTFMAGLIAGAPAEGSPQVGVAPGANIVSVKVAGADGSTTLSKVIAGIGWVVEHGDHHGVRVLNLSIAAPTMSSAYQSDPLSAAVEAAWASGITVVAAAGNEGGAVASPGRDPWVVTVGAVDLGSSSATDDDIVPAWSARQAWPTYAKPELLAPGVSVVSAAAPGSTVVAQNPESVINGRLMRGSGTSMATALTSGAAAVLTSRHAAATPDDVKSALVVSGREMPGEIGRMVRLSAADKSQVDGDGDWWQAHPVAFAGLGIGLSDRMPWATEWAGTRWAGTRWAEAEWSGTRWAGTRWAGTRWAGTRWAEAEWSGTRWAGTRWAGAEWSGTRWAGTRWATYAWTP